MSKDDSAAIEDASSVSRREIEVLDDSIFIEQNFSGEELGATVWDAAIVLIKYLESEKQFPKSFWEGKSVLELGAGTGACGIAVGRILQRREATNSKVIITDRPQMLPLIQRNIDFNFKDSKKSTSTTSVEAQVHWWGEDIEGLLSHNGGRPFDVIVMSDIVAVTYSSTYPLLFKTLLESSASHTRFLLAYELRSKEDRKFFEMLMDNGFSYKKVDNSLLHPEYRADDIGIFEITR
eukprot:TRINITY_DN1536_c0_g1_i1.p1 TRINITY_DN1536_c0_g1~~TRINITY_DN1536_c0_g1_i1.p1  ORF type:complete len:236 (+),score=45.04 TRINITY_DN1536_c0_g1_i1:82-789(+)